MKKLGIFVEGETELDFVSKLLEEIAGKNNLTIIQHKFSGDGVRTGGIRTMNFIKRSNAGEEEKLQAWIYVSGTDNRVNQDIKDQYHSLKTSNFDKIIGLKDLRGEINGITLTISHLPQIELGARVIEQYCSDIHTKIVIAVMEIETWFLAETNHYSCIDNRLTSSLINANTPNLGFNPYTDDLTLRATPTEDLKKIYQLVGKSYSKRETARKRTINCLDYSNIYLSLKNKIDKLDELIVEIDDCI